MLKTRNMWWLCPASAAWWSWTPGCDPPIDGCGTRRPCLSSNLGLMWGLHGCIWYLFTPEGWFDPLTIPKGTDGYLEVYHMNSFPKFWWTRWGRSSFRIPPREDIRLRKGDDMGWGDEMIVLIMMTTMVGENDHVEKTHRVYLTLSKQIEGQLGWFPLMVYGDFPWLSLKDLQTRLCNKITPAPACGSWSPHRWCWCSSPQKAKVIFPKTGAEPHSCLWPSFKGIQRQTNIKIMC